MSVEELKVESKWDGRLSYSSYTMYKQCPRKYWHKKIGKTPIDSDAEDGSEAMDIGSAFHKVLEETNHVVAGLTANKIKAIVAEFELDWNSRGPLICAMLKHYGMLHEKQDLEPILCELEVVTENFRGYIDAIMRDGDGLWWIVDLKTFASFHESIPAKLHRDPQLNLYAVHIKEIASALKLKVKDFGGVRYRVVTKSKATPKGSFVEFYERLLKSVKAYDVPVPKAMLEPEMIYEDFANTQVEVNELHGLDTESSLLATSCSFRSCMDYFRPCEFWSNCHGKVYTQGMGQLNVTVSA